MDANILKKIVMVLVPMILSLTVHEFAHAWSAYKLGDDTASSQGRMTLNPLVHIDPIGTLLIPIIGILNMGGFAMFGWARPVPVDPARFRQSTTMRNGMIITAMAGPGSNVILAILSSLVLVVAMRMEISATPLSETVMGFFYIMCKMNIALAVFNMIPIYPLDGSRLLPEAIQSKMAQYQFIAIIGLLLVLNVPIFGQVISIVMDSSFNALESFWMLVIP